MSRYEVIKHSAVIQMTNGVPAIARRLWNLLLANAYDRLPVRDLYTIPFRIAQDYLAFKSHNYNHIRDTLRLLVETRTEFNLLGKDKKNVWLASGLLSSAMLYNGTIEYGFSPHLRRLLYQPSMYARIPLLLPNSFTSKYTLPLYELCLDYMRDDQGAGETPTMPVEIFKEMIGARTYSWEDITKRVLKPALNDITSLTPLRITVRTKKHGRKITDVKFLVQYAAPEGLPKTPAAVVSETLAPSLLHTTRDYEAVFAGLTPEKQVDIMRRADEEIPRLLREYVKENSHTFEQLAKPVLLQNRNILLEEYVQQQALQHELF
jgi:hypothetical protein